MKALLILFLMMNAAFAREAEIYSIDDLEPPTKYIEVSEEGLPSDIYQQLLQQMNVFRFTPLNEARLNAIYVGLKRDPRARMRYPGGSCSTRRAYIQNYFKKMNVVTGKLVLNCPANNGRLRLQDQVSGRNYTYANFHDANIVAVQTSSGRRYRVLDVQFQNNPMSLHDYLTLIENSQRIRPEKRRGTSRGLCYWTITTPYLRF